MRLLWRHFTQQFKEDKPNVYKNSEHGQSICLKVIFKTQQEILKLLAVVVSRSGGY